MYEKENMSNEIVVLDLKLQKKRFLYTKTNSVKKIKMNA